MAKLKITPKFIAEAKGLALNGFTHRQICQSLKISPTTFYKHTNLVDTIREAEDDLRRDIAEDLKTASNNGEVSAQIFLAKRLGLYATSYKMPQIRSTKTALAQISRINSDLASGVIPFELATTLIKNIEVFLKAYEVNVINDRLQEIEEELKARL